MSPGARTSDPGYTVDRWAGGARAELGMITEVDNAMRRMVRTLATATLLLATSALESSGAQAAPREGELIEARIIDGTGRRAGPRCAAPLTRVAGDTLVLAAQWSCPRGDHVANVRVARGSNGSRLEHAGIGLLVGAASGGLLARLAAGDGCTIPGCDDGDFAVGVITMLGVASGGVIGVTVGALMPAGTRWVDVGAARPIRVGRLGLHPGVRVSLVREWRLGPWPGGATMPIGTGTRAMGRAP